MVSSLQTLRSAFLRLIYESLFRHSNEDSAHTGLWGERPNFDVPVTSKPKNSFPTLKVEAAFWDTRCPSRMQVSASSILVYSFYIRLGDKECNRRGTLNSEATMFLSLREAYAWLLNSKDSACQCRRSKTHGFDPWVRKIPCRRKW